MNELLSTRGHLVDDVNGVGDRHALGVAGFAGCASPFRQLGTSSGGGGGGGAIDALVVGFESLLWGEGDDVGVEDVVYPFGEAEGLGCRGCGDGSESGGGGGGGDRGRNWVWAWEWGGDGEGREHRGDGGGELEGDHVGGSGDRLVLA